MWFALVLCAARASSLLVMCLRLVGTLFASSSCSSLHIKYAQILYCKACLLCTFVTSEHKSIYSTHVVCRVSLFQ